MNLRKEDKSLLGLLVGASIFFMFLPVVLVAIDFVLQLMGGK